ncbi:MAG: outer membrane protein assembly factor BamA [Bacteroidetes bacterium]|nr:outer membrane protein assembly factor BamA [Bacteroidota bacterium]MCY4205426.1 outer membrane protein assembly factor BamA [Bacteroidota bacterium]
MMRVTIQFLIIILSANTVIAQSISGSSLASNTFSGPEEFEILGISVEGVEVESMRNFALRSSGLTVGQKVILPGDPAISEAIHSLYKLRVFSDVKIVEERRVGTGVFLLIRVIEEPQLAEFTISGVRKRDRRKLEDEIPLFKGTRVRPADLDRSKQVIKDYFEEKGFLLAEVEVTKTPASENTLNLEFAVDRGEKVRIKEVLVSGNENVNTRSVRRKLKKTKPRRPLFFWRKARYDRMLYEEDKVNLINHFNSKGFYDARIVKDSVWMDVTGEKPGIIVSLKVQEGPRYHIRNIEWEGNTVYPDHVLSSALGVKSGDTYNSERIERNLLGNSASSDVSSLYMNRGHMLFRAEPEIRVVEGDSLDLYYDLYEGDIFSFGEIEIAGNDKTKEHVVRRELYTIPGQTFSRELIQETIRRLSQLKYFDQEKLGAGPSIDLDQEEKKVNLTYNLEEVGSDQLELSGTYGRFGVILQLRFGFNNFSAQDLFKGSAWRPLPSGDGQQLSISLQTSGRQYQNYSLGFTEPWLNGKPTPVGFQVSHSRFSGLSFYGYNYLNPNNNNRNDNLGFANTSARVFYEQRLQWPDDKFSTSTSLGYQLYSNRNFTLALPAGRSQQVTIRQALTRSSVDHPVFPTAGSTFLLSGELALPVSDFIQYHKWKLSTSWNVPIVRKLTTSFSADFGYIGSLTGEDVLFERYIVGGSPFDVQGYRSNFGKDIVYMRGYPARVIGPRRGSEAVGGRILNKFTSELRLLAIQTPQLTAAPYLFMDAANTWDQFQTYNPRQLYRSAGIGARLFLPILGMLEIAYGYNFDEFQQISGQNSNHDGSKKWFFQFTLGQGFN